MQLCAPQESSMVRTVPWSMPHFVAAVRRNARVRCICKAGRWAHRARETELICTLQDYVPGTPTVGIQALH